MLIRVQRGEDLADGGRGGWKGRSRMCGVTDAAQECAVRQLIPYPSLGVELLAEGVRVQLVTLV